MRFATSAPSDRRLFRRLGTRRPAARALEGEGAAIALPGDRFRHGWRAFAVAGTRLASVG